MLRKSISLIICSFLLIGCGLTRETWKQKKTLHHEDIYGATIHTHDGNKCIVVHGKLNDYLIEPTSEWIDILNGDTIRVLNARGTMVADRVEYHFVIYQKNSPKRVLEGQALVVDSEFADIPISEFPYDDGLRVYITEYHPRSNVGMKILATPLTVTADASLYVIGIASFPIWISIVPRGGW